MPLAVNLRQRQHIAGVLALQNGKLVKLLSYRRGIVTVQARSSCGLLACKIAMPGIFKEDEKELRIEIDTVRNVAPELYALHGDFDFLPWLSMHWQEGDTLAVFIKTWATGEMSNAELIALLIRVCARFEALHTLGWMHGDVQPRHILIEQDQIILLDWGLAHRLGDIEFPYQGAMVHFVAPEVARAQIERVSRIAYDVLSEVYALAASMFYAVTGRVVPDYGVVDLKTLSLDEKRACVASGKQVKGFGDKSFTMLEDVLRWALQPERRLRCPSVRALRQALEAI